MFYSPACSLSSGLTFFENSRSIAIDRSVYCSRSIAQVVSRAAYKRFEHSVQSVEKRLQRVLVSISVSRNAFAYPAGEIVL